MEINKSSKELIELKIFSSLYFRDEAKVKIFFGGGKQKNEL